MGLLSDSHPQNARRKTQGLSGLRNNQHFESTSMSLITPQEHCCFALTWGKGRQGGGGGGGVEKRRKTLFFIF